jgi:hypothetical protein
MVLGGSEPGGVVFAVGAERNLIDVCAAQVNDFAARHLLPIDDKELRWTGCADAGVDQRDCHVARGSNVEREMIGAHEDFAVEHGFGVRIRAGVLDGCVKMLAVGAPLRSASQVRGHLTVNDQAPLVLVGLVCDDNGIMIAVRAECNVSDASRFSVAAQGCAGWRGLTIKYKPSEMGSLRHRCRDVTTEEEMLAI